MSATRRTERMKVPNGLHLEICMWNNVSKINAKAGLDRT